MSARTLRRSAAAVLLALVLVGGISLAWFATAPARAASSVESDPTGSFSVTAVAGFSFTPNSFQQLPLNATITVTFTDDDTEDHTFVIIGKQGWVIPASYNSAQITTLAYGSSPAALNAPGMNATADSQLVATFTSPRTAGWYEFVCTEPGHFQNGMYGFIAFGMNLPGNLTVSTASTDPGAPVFIIVGVIVALTVIAIILGFVVGRRRGATYEMPPERLGYPEPEPAPAVPPEPPLPPESKG